MSGALGAGSGISEVDWKAHKEQGSQHISCFQGNMGSGQTQCPSAEKAKGIKLG